MMGAENAYGARGAEGARNAQRRGTSVLVIGGSGSGKSAWAEDRCVRLGGSLRYVATMRPFGSEAAARIERHRALRAGKGFETVECYGALEDCAAELEGATVLLECLGNVVANVMFPAYGDNERKDAGASELALADASPVSPAAGCSFDAEAVARKVVSGVRACADAARSLVVVTNDVHADGVGYEGETACYVQALAFANRLLASECDEVVEVVCGIPVPMKGGAR